MALHIILGRHYHESAADDRPCGSLTPNQNHYWTSAHLIDTSDHRAAKSQLSRRISSEATTTASIPALIGLLTAIIARTPDDAL